MQSTIIPFLSMDNEQLARIIKSGVSTHELDRWSECLFKNYRGTYAIDQFTTLDSITDGGYIINTDPLDYPGTHWLAFHKKGNDKRYFDSFGMKPYSFVDEKIGGNMQYLDCSFQNPKNATCGLYCLFFIHLCENTDRPYENIKKYLRGDEHFSFTLNKRDNDDFILNWFNQMHCPYVQKRGQINIPCC